MKRIIFNLKKEWYDKIESGEKNIEYRRVCKHWADRLGVRWPMSNRTYETLKIGVTLPLKTEEAFVAFFRLGYTMNTPDIVRKITRVDIGLCPYEGWDGEYFRIYFEKGVCAS